MQILIGGTLGMIAQLSLGLAQLSPSLFYPVKCSAVGMNNPGFNHSDYLAIKAIKTIIK